MVASLCMTGSATGRLLAHEAAQAASAASRIAVPTVLIAAYFHPGSTSSGSLFSIVVDFSITSGGLWGGGGGGAAHPATPAANRASAMLRMILFTAVSFFYLSSSFRLRSSPTVFVCASVICQSPHILRSTSSSASLNPS
jgi:hypothetical protein